MLSCAMIITISVLHNRMKAIGIHLRGVHHYVTAVAVTVADTRR
jgi:hypothetical protein